MSGGVKLVVGVGVLALAGGAIYLAYQHRQAMLLQQGAVSPVKVGITSIYSDAGTAATFAGLPLPSAAIVSGVPLRPGFQGGASQPSYPGSGVDSAMFAATAALAASAAPVVVTAPTVEARTGKGHF